MREKYENELEEKVEEINMRKKLISILVVVAMVAATFVMSGSVNAATQAQIDQAIDDGLAYLASVQLSDGSWGGYGRYYVGSTALAVLAFEVQGYLPDATAPVGSYEYKVQMGLDYLFSKASTMSITTQTYGDPDTDSDGIGVYFSTGRPTYETGLVMMAIVASNQPDAVVSVSGSAVNGWKYSDVMVDSVDYYAYGQIDSGDRRGGWGYSPNSGGDNSNSQFPVMGLYAAEQWGIYAPSFVKSELELWINYIQYDYPADGSNANLDGGSGYERPTNWVNVAKTGALLCELAYIGADATDSRVTRAVAFIDRHWLSDNRGNHYAMYAVARGCRMLEIDYIGYYDWYYEYADYLVINQMTDGSWPSGSWGDINLYTSWAVLILTPWIFQPLPYLQTNKEVSPAEVVVGETLNAQVTLTVTGTGNPIELDDGTVINTAGEDVVVTEVLESYINYVPDSFSIQPADITPNPDGTTTIVWDYLHDLNLMSLDIDETWTVTFDITFDATDTAYCGLDVPVDADDSEISYLEWSDDYQDFTEQNTKAFPQQTIHVKSRNVAITSGWVSKYNAVADRDIVTITFYIKNVGEVDEANVHWTVVVDGITADIRPNWEGTITSLPIGETEIIEVEWWPHKDNLDGLDSASMSIIMSVDELDWECATYDNSETRVVTLYAPPEPTITNVFIKPTKIEPGGAVLVFLDATNYDPRGVTTISTSEDDFVVYDLPLGWTAESIDGPTELAPGETGTYVIAVVSHPNTPVDTYTFSISIKLDYGPSEQNPSGEIYSEPALCSIIVTWDMKGNELAEYRHTQNAIRQIRALDRNIESDAEDDTIDLSSMDLSSFGYGGEDSVDIEGTLGTAYHQYGWKLVKKWVCEWRCWWVCGWTPWGFRCWRQCGWWCGWKWVWTYVDEYHAYGGEMDLGHWVEGTEPRTMTYDYNGYAEFDTSSIPDNSDILDTDLTVTTDESYPEQQSFGTDVNAMSSKPLYSSAQTIYEDAMDDDQPYTSLQLRSYRTYTRDLGDQADTDLQSLIEEDWFAVGLVITGNINEESYYIVSYDADLAVTYFEYKNGEEGMDYVLELYRACDSTGANELATYINENYGYSIGYWNLAPGYGFGKYKPHIYPHEPIGPEQGAA